MVKLITLITIVSLCSVITLIGYAMYLEHKIKKEFIKQFKDVKKEDSFIGKPKC